VANKSLQDCLGRDKDILKIKWEFLRRSPKYINDYNRYIIDKDKLKVDERNDFENVLGQVFDRFREKYGVSFPLPPSLSYVDFIKSHCKRPSNSELSALMGKFHFLAEAEFSKGAYCWSGKSKNELSGSPLIEITVDLDSHLQRIMCEVEKIVKERLELRRIAVSRGKKRPRLPEYKKYLSVYDLRQKKWSWKAIARKVAKDDSGDAIRKVKKYLQKCRSLIDGGYAQIR